MKLQVSTPFKFRMLRIGFAYQIFFFRALIWSQIGIALIFFLSVFSGLLLYNKYMDCDPMIANIIKNQDQILPLYVMELVGFIPGLCGLFISGIFSAGLRYEIYIT